MTPAEKKLREQVRKTLNVNKQNWAVGKASADDPYVDLYPHIRVLMRRAEEDPFFQEPAARETIKAMATAPDKESQRRLTIAIMRWYVAGSSQDTMDDYGHYLIQRTALGKKLPYTAEELVLILVALRPFFNRYNESGGHISAGIKQVEAFAKKNELTPDLIALLKDYVKRKGLEEPHRAMVAKILHSQGKL